MGSEAGNKCKQLLAANVQVFSALSSLGVAAAGMVQFHANGSFSIHYCNDGDADGCWKDNVNADVGMALYGAALILLGFFSFICEIRLREYTRVQFLLLVAGVLTLGAAGNTGIVLGSIAGFAGLLQLLLWGVWEMTEGKMKLGAGGEVHRYLMNAVQLFAFALSLALVAVGILSIVSLAQEADGREAMTWCSLPSFVGQKSCWNGDFENTIFALGMYGASIVVFGVIGVIAVMRIKDWIQPLHEWSVLGWYFCVVGVMTLGAAGNTGIVIGALTTAVGAVMVILSTVWDQKQGYVSID